MWYTPSGDRKLQGKERTLFVAGVIGLYEQLTDKDIRDADDDAPPTGISVFDSIPIEARPCVLLHVAEHVLGDGESPELYAWNEGTVRAVFEFIESMCGIEEDDGGGVGFGEFQQLAMDAWKEMEARAGKEAKEDPEFVQTDPYDPIAERDWGVMLDDLMLEVFWDDDFLDAELPDLEPEHGKQLKKHMGIHDDYFRAIPPAITEGEKGRLGAFFAELKKECA